MIATTPTLEQPTSSQIKIWSMTCWTRTRSAHKLRLSDKAAQLVTRFQRLLIFRRIMMSIRDINIMQPQTQRANCNQSMKERLTIFQSTISSHWMVKMMLIGPWSFLIMKN